MIAEILLAGLLIVGGGALWFMKQITDSYAEQFKQMIQLQESATQSAEAAKNASEVKLKDIEASLNNNIKAIGRQLQTLAQHTSDSKDASSGMNKVLEKIQTATNATSQSAADTKAALDAINKGFNSVTKSLSTKALEDALNQFAKDTKKALDVANQHAKDTKESLSNQNLADILEKFAAETKEALTEVSQQLQNTNKFTTDIQEALALTNKHLGQTTLHVAETKGSTRALKEVIAKDILEVLTNQKSILEASSNKQWQGLENINNTIKDSIPNGIGAIEESIFKMVSNTESIANSTTSTYDMINQHTEQFTKIADVLTTSNSLLNDLQEAGKKQLNNLETISNTVGSELPTGVKTVEDIIEKMALNNEELVITAKLTQESLRDSYKVLNTIMEKAI
ncbi:MAG: hypothetical protein BEN18_02590 [Epulopiscium sp. Nuni2H_MBin001]|nr:MAG: hypothetical protein BEN18_02590 [Epulopiscium sp. Nuni2H_MBin001]